MEEFGKNFLAPLQSPGLPGIRRGFSPAFPGSFDPAYRCSGKRIHYKEHGKICDHTVGSSCLELRGGSVAAGIDRLIGGGEGKGIIFMPDISNHIQ